MKATVLVVATICCLRSSAQDIRNNPASNHGNRFEQLGTILPTPNEFRTASGAPGPKYWQQRADYDIKCQLDENNAKLTGNETITYYNNSPDTLHYLWLQLDENQQSTIKNADYQFSTGIPKELSVAQVNKWQLAGTDNKLGVNITQLTNAAGKKINYTINKTMMRVDIPIPLAPKQQCVLKIAWNFTFTDRMASGDRCGYENFEEGNRLFTVTQWYPRMCVYSDFQGWQNLQMTGTEFALGFGNFKVHMTVPADHIVGATGQCSNYQQTLSTAQYQRWKLAQTAKQPTDIVSLEEVVKGEKIKSTHMKTWMFHAENVRDFAWTSSRRLVWDAMPTYIAGKKIMCMSYYGKEAYPIYHDRSTRVVEHTIKQYSNKTIPYPYPVVQAVEAANGMEYPMICFVYGRADKNGHYSDSLKNAMIEGIIHEVGHNFMPMIINSDERQWGWMDEGINCYLEYFAEKSWDSSFPSRRGPAIKVVNYAKRPRVQQEPIMTKQDNILNVGATTYTKTATALHVLRNIVLGDSLFDFAFKEYARRWAFKHPTPADLFRTMEDASGDDLDWFWRGWFYSTE
ncbi:MAG: M1 family metallopeptidase, partial [Flavitalea sp.]